MSEPREIVLLTDAAKKVAEATSIDEVKQIRDAAEAARGQSKKIDLTEDITVDAAAIKVHATRQLGQLLKATELAKGAPGNQYTGKKVVRSQAATGPVRLRDLGITEINANRWRCFMSENTTKPVFKLRYGNVAVAVWLRNTSSAGYFYDTTFTRVFRREDGNWGDSTSFEDRDLPNLAKAAADTHSWIYQQKANAVTVNGSEAA